MTDSNANLSLYNLTLQKGNDVTRAIHGHFSGGKDQEIVLAKGKVLEMIKVDKQTKMIRSIVTQEVFGLVRSILPLHLTSSKKDYIVVGSDSGKTVVLEYFPDKNKFVVVHREPFGRSGCRRAVAGQYLAVEPKGRAAMIAAVDNQKLVYQFNRDIETRLTVSSPKEASKRSSIIYDIVGLDNGFENAMFACLEVDYGDADDDHTGQEATNVKQTLTYYEMDFGTNSVSRIQTVDLDERANMLIPVPENWCSKGVLVCSENFITFRHPSQNEVKCPIPKRRNDLGDQNRSEIINCYGILSNRNSTFLLVQTDQGDLFKVELMTITDGKKKQVSEIQMQYFDTVPKASSICILMSQCIFVASEFGKHCSYAIIGSGEEETTFSSNMQSDEPFHFDPRPLKNLALADEIGSLCPLNGCMVDEDTFQLQAICGSGPISTLKTLNFGLKTDMQASYDSPLKPNAIWTLKKDASSKYDSYIVLSFTDSTRVMEIIEVMEDEDGEVRKVREDIKESDTSGFVLSTKTLACAMIGEGTLVQVHSEGIRQVKRNKGIFDWKASKDNSKKITHCATNQSQIVLVMNDRELVYFECDAVTDNINEVSTRVELANDVKCISMGRVPQGCVFSKFLAVGMENIVNIMSLETHEVFTVLNVQAIPGIPNDISVSEVCGNHYLYVGLQSGVLTRNNLDPVSGDLSNARTNYIGARPLKFTRIYVDESEALLVMSERTWLIYGNQNKLNLVPLSYDSLEIASGFDHSSLMCGIIGIVGGSLRVLNLDNFGNAFNETSAALSYTPRRIALHKSSANAIIIESDQKTYTEDTKLLKKKQMVQELIESAGEDEGELACNIAEQFLSEKLPENIFGEPKAEESTWASLIRIVNNKAEKEKKSVFHVPLEQNEAAVSLCLLRFDRHPDKDFVIVGVVKNLNMNANIQMESAAIHAYHLVDEGSRLELVHKTPVEGFPRAMCSFAGMILIGAGNTLILYDLGMTKMLKKCENKEIPRLIVDIKTMGNRILVSDVHESTFFFTLKKDGTTKKLVKFADDHTPRKVVTTCFLDYHTIAGADTSGNIWVSRLPPNVNDELEDDPTGSQWERGDLNGSSQKLICVAQFFVGEMITSLTKTKLTQYGNEILLYTTISGAIGMLLPIKSEKKKQFLQHLELNLRNENLSLVDRDHSKFRSYYAPVKNVIDGDLCEEFNGLESSVQNNISESMDMSESANSSRDHILKIQRIIDGMRMGLLFEQY